MNHHLRVWENYRSFADRRAQLVVDIIGQQGEIRGQRVLDYGCGEGATARLMHALGALVTACDIRADVAGNFVGTDIVFMAEDFVATPGPGPFDIVILQDVLEHVPDPRMTVQHMCRLLAPGGMIYISTPNRLSFINAVSDPHWSLPLVSLLPRKGVRFVVKTLCRRDRRQRSDWPALLSLRGLNRVLSENGIEFTFVNTYVATRLFQSPEMVVCDPCHVKIVRWIRRSGLEKPLLRLVNDAPGLFNTWVNSTWYGIGRKR